MERFSVTQLAKMAGVSVRTLHHYDKIGLLRPEHRAESKYRYYGRNELLRLQQILLYKELEIPLKQIAEILDDPDFDLVTALKTQRNELLRRKERFSALLETIDNTIHHLTKNSEKMQYEDLYKGLSRETAEAYKKEAIQKYGREVVQNSHEKFLKLSKTEYATMQDETENINKELAASMELSPSDKKVQGLVERHYALIRSHFDCTPEIYRNLGQMYVDDARFTTYYDKYKTGLAKFLRDAILVYTENK